MNGLSQSQYRPARGDVIPLAQLPVGAAEEAVLHQLGVERPVLAAERRWRRENGVRLVLPFVRQEVVQLVADDRPADRGADLLIGVGQHAVGDEILGVQLVVAEEAVDGAIEVVGAGTRDRLHLDAERAALGDVEQVGDDLELGDRLAAEARLAEAAAGHLLGDLLAVEIELEGAVADARVVVHGVGGDALHLHRQLHPVAALQRQFLHLAAVDVAGHLRGADVDERRLAGDREGLAERGHLHGERHRAVLADQHLHFGHEHGGEARQLRLHLVAIRRQAAQAVVAALIADAAEDAPVGQGRRGDGHPRQGAAGRIRHRAEDGRFLRERRRCAQHDGGGKETDGTHAHIRPLFLSGPCGAVTPEARTSQTSPSARRNYPCKQSSIGRTIAHGDASYGVPRIRQMDGTGHPAGPRLL